MTWCDAECSRPPIPAPCAASERFSMGKKRPESRPAKAATPPEAAAAAPPPAHARPIRRLRVANRREIAIRGFRSAHELGIRTVAMYAHEDRFALHRFKADEAYRVGNPGEPLRAYLDIENIVTLAREHDIDAIHPGYGFLSENPHFA